MYKSFVAQVRACSNAFMALSANVGSFSAPYYEVMIDRKRPGLYNSDFDYAIRFSTTTSRLRRRVGIMPESARF